MHFAISLLYPLGNGRGPSFEQTWIPITQGCFVPSLDEIGPVVLENTIFKVRQCLFAISLLFSLGKGRGPSFEKTWIPITQRCFVPSLVEIGPVVLEKILKFSLFHNYLPLEKDMALHLNKHNFPSQVCSLPSLVEIVPVVLKKKIFKFG